MVVMKYSNLVGSTCDNLYLSYIRCGRAAGAASRAALIMNMRLNSYQDRILMSGIELVIPAHVMVGPHEMADLPQLTGSVLRQVCQSLMSLPSVFLCSACSFGTIYNI